MSSFASGKDYKYDLKEKYGSPSGGLTFWSFFDRNLYYASEYYPNGRPAYEEIGDTAFITLEIFDSDYSIDYYKTKPDAKATDSIGVIGYSFSRILRKNSPIKKVVLDLSCNYGGTDDAAAYVLSAFIGKFNLYLSSTLTGAQEIMSSRGQAGKNLSSA